jgi:hypothetical protein
VGDAAVAAKKKVSLSLKIEFGRCEQLRRWWCPLPWFSSGSLEQLQQVEAYAFGGDVRWMVG